jgi:arginyl-tRNA synthetase
MNIFSIYKDHIVGIVGDLAKAGALPLGLDLGKVAAEPPREAAHGDIATNVAMVLAKPAAKNPRDLANLLLEPLKKLPGVTEASIAGPGFINLRLAPATWGDTLRHVLGVGTAFGDGDLGRGEPINVEYVSANPTGPMHVGHARGAVVGDALAALLGKAGFKVTKEYYINDAGGQVNSAARAVRLRYLQALGRMTEDDFQAALQRKEVEYGGTYLIPIAEALMARDGDKWATGDEAAWLEPIKAFVVAEMMKLIKEDLAALGVRHDVFTSEKAILQAGKIDLAVKFLTEAGLVYTGTLPPPRGKAPDDWEPRPLLLFRAEQFGDDIDRPLSVFRGRYRLSQGQG